MMRSLIGSGPGRVFGRLVELLRSPSTGPMYVVIIGSIIAVAVIDTLTPLDLDEWILYDIPLVLSFALFEPLLPIGIAIVATIAIVVASAVSPPGFDVLIEAINRGMGVLALWVTAGVGYLFIRNKLILRRANEALQLEIIERTKYEERERLLIREINHRAKNMLTLVQAIARQTTASEPEDFIEHFTERIQALSANQDLLIRNEWKGVDIDDLAHAQLSHFADLMGSRIAVEGPKLRLKAAGAQAIGLALHELATNAGKYGALSTDRGHVDVRWGADRDTFSMNWTEREGPPVSAPQHRGFGTIVVKAMAERSLDGAVQLDYAPSGLIWRLTCPAARALSRNGGLLADFAALN